MLPKLSPAALALGAIVSHIGGSLASSLDRADIKRQTGPNEATAFAAIYGYPIIQYSASLGSVINSTGPNTIYNEKHTATADEAAIVRPNVDTLYSKIPVDLSSYDVALTIPKVDDGRFYVFPFYDVWSNNFVNLGSLNATLPGTYLLRYTGNPANAGFEPSEAGSGYLGIINFPTVYGLVLPRILLRNNSTDLDIVHKIQAQIKVKTVSQHAPFAPILSYQLLGSGALDPLALVAPGALDSRSITRLLEVVARIAPFNLPADPSQIPRVYSLFRSAGLSNGVYSPPSGVDYAAVNKLINAALVKSDKGIELFNNEWFDFPANSSGNFHNNYPVRSTIAYTGYLQLTQDEALYPEWIGSGIRGLSLADNECYTLTFSGKPPVNGFWSLTAYNSSSYLIPNDLNRYSLGDRSNLRYPDRELVYGDNNRNDSFTILIQPADVNPPRNWTSNWLPAPAGGGNFTVNLRFYGPTTPLFAGGSYVYPVVKKGTAITG